MTGSPTESNTEANTEANIEAEADPRAVLAGVPFDPNRHEAADAVDAPDAEPGTVVAVLQPGYMAADGLVRPAVVAVARKPD
jgi:molecular chaperone GrpE